MSSLYVVIDSKGELPRGWNWVDIIKVMLEYCINVLDMCIFFPVITLFPSLSHCYHPLQLYANSM